MLQTEPGKYNPADVAREHAGYALASRRIIAHEKIEAVIKPFKLEEVKDALAEVGI